MDNTMILQTLLDIKKNTDKMAAHIDFVEAHISWIEKIAAFILPSFAKHKHNTTDSTDLDSVV